MYKDLRERATVFSGLLACRTITVNVSGHGETQAAHAEPDQRQFFPDARSATCFGRLFASSDETAPGANTVAVLSYSYLVAAIRRRPSHLKQAAYGERRPADRCRRGSQKDFTACKSA